MHCSILAFSTLKACVMSDSATQESPMIPSVLPRYLYTAEQVRKLDQLLIEVHNVPGIVLMKRAGRAAFEKLNALFPHGSITVLCGSGNNAGDGFVVAALAHMARRDVQVLTACPPQQLRGDARRAYLYAKQDGVNILPYEPGAASHLPDGCVIVDALVGTGLSGQLRADMQQIIHEVNLTRLPVIALDIPSGLCANTGRTLGEAIKAYATITFIGFKAGLLTAKAPALTGQLFFDRLGAPSKVYRALSRRLGMLITHHLKGIYPPKKPMPIKGKVGMYWLWVVIKAWVVQPL